MSLTRIDMKNLVATALLAISAVFAIPPIFASGAKEAPLVFVWLPDDALPEATSFRVAVDKVIADATGRQVVDKLTTDYTFCIEAMVANTAALAYFGGLQYLQAHAKNESIVPLVTNSGPSGTMNDASYYSRICVKTSDAPLYTSTNGYALDRIQAKRVAFVSLNSTSGFLFPAAGIVAYFSKMAAWSKLTPNDLLEGGDDKFFSQVVFSGSHAGAATALRTDKSDVAAFADSDLRVYTTLAYGTENAPGAIYQVKDGAAEPFNTLAGQRFTVIWSVPVTNGPICANLSLITSDEQKKIVAALTADSVAMNPAIFAPADYRGPNKIDFKQTGKVKFLPVDDTTYQPMRDMIR
jgi:phosphonate transport system substrate-binding protein